MNATSILGQQGRFVIPADIRRALGLAPGDRLHLRVTGQRLVLELVDELIADRRLSAAAE
jgi:AbrB family looped-hinge helix DNA binding protein